MIHVLPLEGDKSTFCFFFSFLHNWKTNQEKKYDFTGLLLIFKYPYANSQQHLQF